MSVNNIPAGPFTPLTPTDVINNLLCDWFPVRDRLNELRNKALLSVQEIDEIDQKLRELVDIGDELVAQFVPSAENRWAITANLMP